MKAKQESDQPKDELSQRLQDALRQRRPRPLRIVVVVVGLALAMLGFLAWWLYPRPAPPRLGVIAFDQVGVAGENVTLAGGLELAPGETRTAPLQNLELVFEDGKLAWKPGEQAKQTVVKTAVDGYASCLWKFPADFTQGDFIVRRIGTLESPGTEDRGRVVLWPRESRLVLVQIEQTLTPARDSNWENDDLLDIRAAAGAAETLAALEAAKYHVTYLALDADRPLFYQKMRRWVTIRTRAGPVRFPAGPVLARFPLKQDAKPWQQTAAVLKEKYAGPHLAIAGTIDAAQQLHAAGFTVYFLGQGQNLPQGIERLEGWAELRRIIAKK
jgi:hypothetical protein